MIDSSEGALWFIGDLSDPWVVAIAEAVARCTGIVQVHCPSEIPECPYDLAQPPRLVIVHRQRLTAADAQRLRRYRDPKSSAAAPAIILCVSPYVRYDELERGPDWRIMFFLKRPPPMYSLATLAASSRDGKAGTLNMERPVFELRWPGPIVTCAKVWSTCA